MTDDYKILAAARDDLIDFIDDNYTSDVKGDIIDAIAAGNMGKTVLLMGKFHTDEMEYMDAAELADFFAERDFQVTVALDIAGRYQIKAYNTEAGEA